jgi:hypothetical protein
MGEVDRAFTIRSTSYFDPPNLSSHVIKMADGLPGREIAFTLCFKFKSCSDGVLFGYATGLDP